MASQPPKSFAALLWAALRIGARTIWRSSANPARSFMQRQQALSVLGLPSNATAQQIKRRYRLLAKRYHPDRGGDQRQMQRIIAAYELLMREQATKRPSL
ncbi:MAG TPA: J domain-containing protein [Ktedonobacteraceae bacterium]|jgi:preprotein translocase subunit Sec63|nr:J domain-containing protein [Ktedonobacteraceae bacterium]